MNFINRDWERCEDDDFKLNVQPYLGKLNEAVPIHDNDGTVFCWKIQSRYE